MERLGQLQDIEEQEREFKELKSRFAVAKKENEKPFTSLLGEVLPQGVRKRAGNIVNRLGTNGIQIEQSRKACDSYSLQIADAVADVIGLKIKVCTAPVFEGSNPWTCLMRSIRDSVVVMSRAGVPCIPCEIKRLLFRIRNCRRGNTDPCIEL
ncbi:MAG: hypothetical protein ACRENW_03810 [Thermodesulfobacteriota bacterium]